MQWLDWLYEGTKLCFLTFSHKMAFSTESAPIYIKGNPVHETTNIAGLERVKYTQPYPHKQKGCYQFEPRTSRLQRGPLHQGSSTHTHTHIFVCVWVTLSWSIVNKRLFHLVKSSWLRVPNVKIYEGIFMLHGRRSNL